MSTPTGRREALEVLIRRGLSQRKACRYLGLSRRLPDEKGRFSPYPTFPYSAHIAVVDVDVETGVVELESYYAVDDCGVVITPRFVDGQLYGAIAQGIGGALWEELTYDYCPPFLEEDIWALAGAIDA
jgi:CO/xanthine dehydrogenase Mo-binding subunit